MTKRLTLLVAALFCILLLGAVPARAVPPLVGATWTTAVAATSAAFHAEVTPVEGSAFFHFEYITQAAYQANLSESKDGFAGAKRTEPDGSAGTTPHTVQATATLLSAETTYRYRAFAKNASASAFGPERVFRTQGFGGALQLLDNRGWEMVSPVDKNGGEIQGFGENSDGGVLQAAAGGGIVTFSSASSFDGGQGAPNASQYVSSRGPGAWSTANITAPLFAGGYGDNPDGVPYQLFSTDLSRGLLAGVPYPPLAGTGAPAGYRNFYLRDDPGGSFQALIQPADVAGLGLPPQNFELEFAGASPDLDHVVLSTCAALSADATEVLEGPERCDAGSPNLYERSPGTGLELINLRPGESVGTPGAHLAAPSGAVSEDGSRVYWTEPGGHLYLREDGTTTVELKDSAGEVGGSTFQTATPSGSVAFFSKGGHLFRDDVGAGPSTDLTPGGGVQGMLGASADGSYAYYLTASGLFLNHAGASTEVATAADLSNVPPSTGTARVTADGTRLAFLSSAGLLGYDNQDAGTGKPDSEVYLYDAGAAGGTGSLVCASCNPTNERPAGPSSIPGAIANGEGEGATQAYKPRALSADGRRLFFDSGDSLTLKDINPASDVYEWEAAGTGSCAKAGGCLQLISSGQGADGASFVDASASGADAFFLTGSSLVPADPLGSVDLYDARADGGFPEPPNPIPCEGDACQSLPPPPDDPAPGTLVPSTGNPPVHFSHAHGKRHKHRHRHGRRHRHLRATQGGRR